MNNRAVAVSTVKAYQATFTQLKNEATKLVERNTLALSRCVLTLKQSLPHGEFTDVCEQALKLDANKRGALVKVGRELMQGQHTDDTLKMLNQMEPRAAAKFIEQPQEIKNHHVVKFETTGEVPTRTTFTPKKRVDKVNTTKTDLINTIDFLTTWLQGVEKLSPEGRTKLVHLAESLEQALNLPIQN